MDERRRAAREVHAALRRRRLRSPALHRPRGRVLRHLRRLPVGDEQRRPLSRRLGRHRHPRRAPTRRRSTRATSRRTTSAIGQACELTPASTRSTRRPARSPTCARRSRASTACAPPATRPASRCTSSAARRTRTRTSSATATRKTLVDFPMSGIITHEPLIRARFLVVRPRATRSLISLAVPSQPSIRTVGVPAARVPVAPRSRDRRRRRACDRRPTRR